MNKKEELKNSLVDVLSIQTSTHKQEKMIEYIKNKLNSLKIKFTQDSSENIIVKQTDSQATFIAAHMDTVHSLYDNAEIYITSNENLFMLDAKDTKQIGIGGDDKVGVWALLEILKTHKNVNAIFFSNEERGFIGSSAINMDIFSNCNWIIQLDRRGNSDFICGDMSSEKFQKDCKSIYEKYKYTFSPSQTTATDVAKLIDRGLKVSAVNISCGYYNPHSDKEYVNITDAINALNMTIELIENLGNTKYDYVAPVKQYNSYYNNNGYYNGYNNYNNRYKNNYSEQNKHNTYQSSSIKTPEEKLLSILKIVAYLDPLAYTLNYTGILSLNTNQLETFKTKCFETFKETPINIIGSIKDRNIKRLLTHLFSHI